MYIESPALPELYGARVDFIKLDDTAGFSQEVVDGFIFPIPELHQTDIEMVVMTYCLYLVSSITSLKDAEDDVASVVGDGQATQELPDARVYPMPNEEFDGLWESY